jgi:sugar-specific transcriptional regulator TrmB/DNA-binding CsgD family transcriptional regulator
MRPLTGADDDDSPLRALGLTPAQETVYVALLRNGSPSPETAGLRLAVRDVTRVLDELEQLGLVARSAATSEPVPAPPGIALSALLQVRLREIGESQRRLDDARAAIEELSQQFQDATRESAADLIDVVHGEEALARRFVQLVAGAGEEILLLDKPPYAQTPGDFGEMENALRRGVTVRVIYDVESLHIPGSLDNAHRLRDLGEQGRVAANLPLKLLIVDREWGLLPMSVAGAPLAATAVIHTSALLNALTFLFENLWAGARDLIPTGVAVDELPSDAREILTLLAAGLKDEAIARHLGLSLRTVSRRVGDLLDLLGAHTRFEAGLKARDRGWL